MAMLALGMCLSGILWKAVLFVFVLLLEGMAFYDYKYSINAFYWVTEGIKWMLYSTEESTYQSLSAEEQSAWVMKTAWI